MVRRYNYNYKGPFNLNDMDREKDSIHSVPFWIGLLVILGLWGSFGIVVLLDSFLPTPLSVSDEIDYPNAFIAERAIQDLKFLVDLGPKIVGSFENEYVVVDFLTRRVNQIISEAHPSQYIELDVQSATGGYNLGSSTGFLNVYDRVQNVIAKVHGRNNSEHSILLNCHFDTVPISPGGSDDGINVVNMLEILRKFSQSEERQQHNVIFLFNGAEETTLQASHGFTAHHRWANESKVVINLEASGAEGKLSLFQVGPESPWLIKYYSKVPNPLGGVGAQDIFESGLIPSDTDFRIFRDFVNMVGVDMAYTKNGYRYHTKNDGFSNIPGGSYQQGGENTLSLAKSFANAPEVLEEKRATGSLVFFDVFGWFMIYYSAETGLIINWCVVAVSFVVFIVSILSFRTGMSASIWKYFLLTLLAIVFSWLLALLSVIAIVYLLDALNETMSWYATPWFIFGLYVVPILALSGCLMFVTNHRNLSLGVRAQFQAHLVRILWTVVLIVGTVAGLKSVFVISVPILFTSVGFLIIHLFSLQHTVRTWQVIYVISLIIPTIYAVGQLRGSLMIFIPIAGRLGSKANPELYIGVISALFTFLTVTPLTVLSNLLRRGIWYYLTLLVTFLVFFGILFTPLGFPYVADENSPRPQRHWMMHIQREFFDETFSLVKTDSGIFMNNMDRNSPNILKPYVKEISEKVSIEEDCQRYPLCAMPLIHSKVLKDIENGTWIPTSVPVFPENETLSFRLLSKENLSSTQIKYNVQVSGPDKLTFYIVPKLTTTLLNISLIDVVTLAASTFQDRPIYVVLYQLGKGDGTPLKFGFTVETPLGFEGPAVDLAVVARYVHENRYEKIPAYMDFINQFPDWAHVISWVGAYQSYVL